MTIDEAIEFSRYKASQQYSELDGYEYDAQEHQQLAEWLEELKLLRQQNSELQDVVASLECQLGCVREDAIDNFISKCVSCGIVGLSTFHDMSLIAEQLKDGVK